MGEPRKTDRRWGTCLKGHELDDTNTYTWTDKQGRLNRKCAICTKARDKKRRSHG